MYKKIIFSLFTLIVTLTLGACASSAKNEASVEDRSIGAEADSSASDIDAGADAVTSFGTDDDEASALATLDDPSSALSVRIIYFGYDSVTIQPQFNDAIAAHSNLLAQNPDITISLEGHTDDRGSREYNLALGERRAQAVKQQMVLLGASPAQLRATSYGEERPIDNGDNEQSWAQNRRVQILYSQDQ